jgi:hypothetical protein
LEKGRIISAWKEMLIFMIHKKDDTNDPNNYRGITLSATTYKIMSKIITRRMLKITEKIDLVHKSQGVGKTGFAAYNEVRTLHNIIEDVNQHNKELHVCYIDLVKAYDRVEKWAVEEILEKLGFPTELKNMIIDINSGVKVRVESDFGRSIIPASISF